MKTLTTIDQDGITTEHHGKSFEEVIQSVGEDNVEIHLNRYDQNVIGYVFVNSAKINGLTKEHYYEAYDKLF